MDSSRSVNSWVAPLVRAGFASPCFSPAGLIVLETVGRKSGRPHRTLVVANTLGQYIWVGTVRGRTSDWLRNAQANGDVRYWLAGEERRAWAYVTAPGAPAPDLAGLAPEAQAAAVALTAGMLPLGFAFAILAPVD